MTAVVLPTTLGVVTTRLRLLDFGGFQTPMLGGSIQRIERLGSRYAMDVELPPMAASTALAWIQRLKRGRTSMVRMRVPQPGFTPDTAGVSPAVVATTVAGGASSVVLYAGGSTTYTFREGQFWSVIHSSRSYLYSVDSDVTVDSGSGQATVATTPMLRTGLTASDVIEITTPIIEGFPEGDETMWTVDAAAHYGLSFTIAEAE